MSEAKNRDQTPDEEAFFQDSQDPNDVDPMGIAERKAARVRGHRSRGLVMFLIFVAFTGVLSWLLADDLIYFFRSTTPVDLGRAEDLSLQELSHNDFIQVTGIARDMCIRAEVFSSRLRFLYLMGSEMGARILIQAPAVEEKGCAGAIERIFTGRLVDLRQTERFDAVLKYYREHFPSAPRSGQIYLLEDSLKPWQAWYFPVAILCLACLAGLNLFFLQRRRRRDAASLGG